MRAGPCCGDVMICPISSAGGAQEESTSLEKGKTYSACMKHLYVVMVS